MGKKIGLISNACSGWNRKHLDKVERLVGNEPEILHQKINHSNKLSDILRSFAEHNIEFLVINGGDGTIQSVLTCLVSSHIFQTFPNIVLVNGGSANMLPKDTGLKKTPVKALQDLLDWTRNGNLGLRIIRRNILRVDYHDQDWKTVYGMFLGTGLIYRTVQIYQKKIQKLRVQGELNPILTTFYTAYLLLFKKRQYLQVMKTGFDFNGDLQTEERNYLFFLTTLNRLVLGLSPRNCTKQDKIKFVLIRPGLFKFFRFLWFLLRSLFNIPNSSFSDFKCFNRIEFYPCPGFILDGEIFEPVSKDTPVIVSKFDRLRFLTR